jgi:membrane-bound ClpP family serine protease
MAEKTTQKESIQNTAFAFSKENYIFLFLGLIVMAIGFLLMIGGKSEDPQVFNEAIFNFQRLTLAPILIIAGYIIEIYAIMKKPKGPQ